MHRFTAVADQTLSHRVGYACPVKPCGCRSAQAMKRERVDFSPPAVSNPATAVAFVRLFDSQSRLGKEIRELIR